MTSRLRRPVAIVALAVPIASLPTFAGPDPLTTVASHPDRPTAVASRDEDVWITRETYTMGTVLRIRVAAADRPTALRASEAALRAVREVDDLLSTWRTGTPLATLNAAPLRRPLPMPPALLALLVEVRDWARRTGGAFDPAVGALVDAWGLRGDGRVPSRDRVERALRSTGHRCFQLDPRAGRAARSCENAWLDSGAFGKGAALRRARAALESAGARSAILDFGGQQLAFGLPDRGAVWTVDVAHPARRGEAAARLEITGGSVATTGQSERAIRTAHGRIGHVIDPRSGHPVPAWGSVTVVHDDPLVADVLSTALFVMGPADGAEWLRRRPEIAALFVVEGSPGLSLRPTAAMRSMLEVPVAPALPARPGPPGPSGNRGELSTPAGEIPNHQREKEGEWNPCHHHA